MIQEDFEQHVVKLQNALLGFAKSRLIMKTRRKTYCKKHRLKR